MKKLMKILDGNKSIITLLSARLLGLDAMADFLGPDLLSWVAYGIDLLTAGAVTHHGMKGKFTTKEN